MKKIITLTLLILLFCFPAHAQDLAMVNQAVIGGGSTAVPSTFCSSSTATTSGLTGVLCEDFEGIVECKATYTSNCRAGWTGGVSGTPNFDAAGFNGSTYSLSTLSCNLAADTQAARIFTESTGVTYYWYSKVIFTAGPTLNTAAPDFINIKASNSGSGWAGLNLYYDTNHYHIRVASLGGTAAISTATVSLNTLHHLWIKTIVGTGTNATTQVQFTTTGTRPGEWADCATNNNCVQSTNGTSTGTPDSIAVFSNYTSATNCVDTYIDDIFVSATEIGNNP
jgi:hypothetical protein